MKPLSLAYLILLTVALLVRNPFGPLGPELDRTGAMRYIAPAAHFGCFALLAFLSLRARWPLSPAAVVPALLAYAAATELLQGLAPPRVPDPADFVLNVLGVAVGAAVWGRLARRTRTPLVDEPAESIAG